MTRKTRSTTLYSHPFSRAYWRDAAAELKSTKMLVVAALMIALRVATKGLALPIAPGLDLFNVASFITALSSMIIGPVLAVPAAVISDFLGVLIWDGLAAYFPPYVLTEIASSLIWALLLYRAKVSTWRTMAGRFLICLLVNILLGTPLYNLYQEMMGKSTVLLTWPRIFKNIFMFPIEALVMTFFLSVMIPITTRMGLTYHKTSDKLRFHKAQWIALVLLFVVGIGSVVGYLFYHHQTTSLSSSYGSTRADHNREMLEFLQQEEDIYDAGNYLTIVDTAIQPFLSSNITYTVSIYSYTEMSEEDLNNCWAYSKSKPATDSRLTFVETVTIVVDSNSNEVLDLQRETPN